MIPDFVQKCWSFVKSFFSGFFRPFRWMESRTASAGLFVSLFLLVAFAAGVGVLFVVDAADSLSGGVVSNDIPDATSSGTATMANDPNCNTLGIEIRGCIVTYKPDNADSLTGAADSPCDAITSSEEVIAKLDAAADDPKIKAAVLEIDSGGGSPVAAEEIAASMKAFGKPSVAWVRSGADSAAYWIATAADTIFASPNSDIGSIGVTQSYVDNAKKNASDGVTYNQLTTGKYKDTGTPNRALTADERTLIQRDLNITLQNFIKAVAANRRLPVEKVTALADGSTMLGAMALQNGLIDQLGTKQDVWKKLEADIGEKPSICWR